MDDHVNVLPSALVAAEAADKLSHHKVRSESLGERCRAQDG
jgi:hypothetical protein